MQELCSDWHAPYTQCPLHPTPWAGAIHCSLRHFRTLIHGFVLRNIFKHKYTSDIYNFNSCLAHLYALWMEHVRFETGIMAEYPLMSTSKDTYVQMELTYEMYRAGGGRIENCWFTHSVSSPGRAYQVVHKSQMSAFEVVGAFLIVRELASRLPPPLYAPATKHVCDKWRQKSFSTL